MLYLTKEEVPLKEAVPLEDACYFDNDLRCHPKTAGIFNSEQNGKTYKTGGIDKNLLFVEKVCVNCPTHIFIKDKGLP